MEPQGFCPRNAGGLQKLVGYGFIHADRGRQHAASDIGDAAELQKPLYGAVLAVFPVQDGEDYVDRQDFEPFPGAGYQPFDRTIGGEESRAVCRMFFPGTVGDLLYRTGIQHPAAVLRNAHGDHLVPVFGDVFYY